MSPNTEANMNGLKLLWTKIAQFTEVLEGMADPPSDSAVRALLRILEQKGHVKREEIGNRRFDFRPARPRNSARPFPCAIAC